VTALHLDLSTKEKTLTTEVSVLREQLIQLQAWPEAGDQYLEMLAYSHWDMFPVYPRDYDWIPTAVKDVISGIDIGSKYPSFFQKVLTNAELRQGFLTKLLEISKQDHPIQ